MSTLDDLQKIQEYQEYTYQNLGRESLLAKYGIPIQHFEFEYVARCKDANELEKMIEVLRSGQEGYYPDLLRAMENQLRYFRPNSRFLRQTCRVLAKSDLKKDELDQIANDLQKWVTDVSRCSKELDGRKSNNIKSEVKIRNCETDPQPLNLVKTKTKERIASTDYKAWDKYDPDVEIMKLDLEEEKMRKEAEKMQGSSMKLKHDAEKYVHSETNSEFVLGTLNKSGKQQLKKSVTFNRFSTEAEAIFISERELQKGREFFKSADYELALQSFSRSIASKPSVINLNNRSLTYLKLKRYEEALKDSERVLAIDDRNGKALLRKAQALEGLKKYEEALDCVDLVIEKDPNNTIAQELAERVRKHCRNVLKNTRMKIVEIE